MWILTVALALGEEPLPANPPLAEEAPEVPEGPPPVGLWPVAELRTVEGRVPIRVRVPSPGAPVTTRALLVPVGDTWAALTSVIAIVPEGDGVAVRFEPLTLADAVERGTDGVFDGLIVVEPPAQLVVLEPHGLRAADRPLGMGPIDCDIALDWSSDGRPEVVVVDGVVYRRTGKGRAGWKP